MLMGWPTFSIRKLRYVTLVMEPPPPPPEPPLLVMSAALPCQALIHAPLVELIRWTSS
jgi:hypothetical protein